MNNSINEHALLEEIDLSLADGMPVYDANGDSVGDVKMYSTTAGYLVVDQGPFNLEDLYLPFRLIRSIDPNDLFLSEPKEVLTSHYTQPPKISTVTEERLVMGPDGTMTTQKRDVQTVQSGYDGLPATLNSVDVTTSPIVLPSAWWSMTSRVSGWVISASTISRAACWLLKKASYARA